MEPSGQLSRDNRARMKDRKHNHHVSVNQQFEFTIQNQLQLTDKKQLRNFRYKTIPRYPLKNHI